MLSQRMNLETENVKGAEQPWLPFVPHNDKVLVKYHRIDPVRGEVILSLRIPSAVQLPRHYYTGTVIGHTLRGAWCSLERDWLSTTGDTVYVTAGTSHTPISVGAEEALVFMVVSGEIQFVDDAGNLTGRENWGTALRRYHSFCSQQGLEPRDLAGIGTH